MPKFLDKISFATGNNSFAKVDQLFSQPLVLSAKQGTMIYIIQTSLVLTLTKERWEKLTIVHVRNLLQFNGTTGTTSTYRIPVFVRIYNGSSLMAWSTHGNSATSLGGLCFLDYSSYTGNFTLYSFHKTDAMGAFPYYNMNIENVNSLVSADNVIDEWSINSFLT